MGASTTLRAQHVAGAAGPGSGGGRWPRVVYRRLGRQDAPTLACGQPTWGAANARSAGNFAASLRATGRRVTTALREAPPLIPGPWPPAPVFGPWSLLYEEISHDC